MSPTLPNPHHPTSEELFAYRDGELPADRRVLIEAHVVACAQCRERIDAMSSAEADLRSGPDAVDEEYFERMTESVLAKVGAGVRVVSRGPAREERSAPVSREPATREPSGMKRRVTSPPGRRLEPAPAGPSPPSRRASNDGVRTTWKSARSRSGAFACPGSASREAPRPPWPW